MSPAYLPLMLAAALGLACACNGDPPAGADDETEGYTGTGSGGSGDATAETSAGDGDGDDGPTDPPLFEPCDGDPRAAVYGIEAPLVPQGYDLPELAVTVNDTPSLLAALEGAPSDIVLADGVYLANDDTLGGVDLGSHRLWGATLLGASLEFGLRTDTTGAELHGLRIAPVDATQGVLRPTEDGYLAHYAVFSGEPGLVVEDCEFTGGEALAGALRVQRAGGERFSRLRISGFTQSSIYLGSFELEWAPGEEAEPAPRLHDLQIDDIGWFDAPVPDGVTPEDQWGLRINDRAELRRVRIRNAGRTGILLSGRASHVEITSLDVDDIPGVQNGSDWDGSTAVSFGRSARDVSIEGFCVGSDSRIGFNGQWHGEPNPTLHAVRPLIASGYVASQRFGVHMDAGSIAARVEGVEFENYRRAAIVFFQNLASEDDLDTTPVDPDDPDAPNPAALWSEDASVAVDNSFAPGCDGVPEVSYIHWNSHPLCP